MWINTKGTIPLVGLDAAGIKQRQGRWPGSLDENLDPPYTSPNASVVIHRLKDSPLRPGHVRAPGKVANVLGRRDLVDEIAAAAGEDAVAYRLNAAHRSARRRGRQARVGDARLAGATHRRTRASAAKNAAGPRILVRTLPRQ